MKFMATPQSPIRPSLPEQAPHEEDGNQVVLERQVHKLAPPPMYQVVMLNDDFTPMEFVIVVLQEYFGKDREQATHSKSIWTGAAYAASIHTTLRRPR